MANRFEFDKDFEENLRKASNKSGSSLRPLFDKVRKVTDEIAQNAKLDISLEAHVAEGDAKTAKKDYSNTGRKRFQEAKAKAFALRSAANSTVPIMDYDGEEIFGRILINRRGSDALEYGGLDPVAEIGKGTGQYLQHPTYAFLRRALDRSAS